VNNTNENLYQEEYNAIVVGTGISEDWAVKEFCENGLKTLVLEGGRIIKHVIDYPTAILDPWMYQMEAIQLEKPKRKS